MVTESLGNRIKSLRKAAGLSVAKIAETTGASTATIYNWESGVYEPTYSQLKALASALGLEVVELIAEEGETFPELVARVPEILPPDERETLAWLHDHIDALKAAALGSEKAAELHRRKQEEAAAKTAPTHAAVGRESSPIILAPKDAEALYLWVKKHTLDLPAESETWRLTDLLLTELARLSGRLSPPVHPDKEPAHEGSFVTNVDGDEAVSKRAGKTKV